KPSFLKNLSIIDNIVYPAFQLGEINRSEIVKEAMALMEELGISSVAEHDIYKVSGGQLQRAAICRAMINHPDILFGDELTGALNSSTTKEVSGIIDNINKRGTTVLIVTHDANVAVHADKVIYLEDGKIMDTLNLGKYDEGNAGARDAEMKNWLKKMGF
ncbi:MAG: ATP-binding cassette domain-containing protein, partial [Lachnospiraceae bacterium]|nr:ATP-binding cassette domain-containing protein [Lachnospiraceae bacterium]